MYQNGYVHVFLKKKNYCAVLTGSSGERVGSRVERVGHRGERVNSREGMVCTVPPWLYTLSTWLHKLFPQLPGRAKSVTTKIGGKEEKVISVNLQTFSKEDILDDQFA